MFFFLSAMVGRADISASFIRLPVGVWSICDLIVIGRGYRLFCESFTKNHQKKGKNIYTNENKNSTIEEEGDIKCHLSR
jgi:hypothetical protein